MLHKFSVSFGLNSTLLIIKGIGFGHTLRRNYLPKHIIEGKIEERIRVTGRHGRRRKQLLGDLKERRGFWKLKKLTLVCILLETSFGIIYVLVARETVIIMNFSGWVFTFSRSA